MSMNKYAFLGQQAAIVFLHEPVRQIYTFYLRFMEKHFNVDMHIQRPKTYPRFNVSP